MNDMSIFFFNHLQSSADGLVWAAHQLRSDRWLLTPPLQLGEWSAARHLFHMAYYEETIALPSMRQWLGDPMPDLEGVDEDQVWDELADRSIQALELRFQAVRQAQIDLLAQFDAAAWERPLPTVWAPLPLRWVVGKTFQHTAEHTNDVMKLALNWDAFK